MPEEQGHLELVSKVLVFDNTDTYTEGLKNFFAENGLIGLKVDNRAALVDTLKANIDLGAIIIGEEMNDTLSDGAEHAEEIQSLRKELPIILHRKNTASDDGLSPQLKKLISGIFQGEDFEALKKLMDKFLFNRYYPAAFIRGIQEISEQALKATFPKMMIACGPPYLIRDRIIFGELFSLIPLEGHWCRGYLMVQTEEATMSNLIANGYTSLKNDDLDFRTVNNLMSEITNMMWGSFKSRFFNNIQDTGETYKIQVPIIINHDRKYITFGVDDPQLCFLYVMEDPEGKIEPVQVFQKLVFHLGWQPEEFKEVQEDMDNLVDAGELELF